MIASKKIKAITAFCVAFGLLCCGFIVYAAGTFDTSRIPEYQAKLFGEEVLSIEIHADEEDWQNLLDNAQAKEWISADVTINGELFTAVGIRTKGNSSLTQMANSQDARYSLQFKFDEYVKGQNCYGLDAFCVNNMMSDATYMKDYISYDIMRYIGVEAPLTNYASVTVNGEAYCFGIALERYDKSYLDRAFNTSGGQLYSVKISMGGRGDFEDARLDTAAANAAFPEPGAERGGVGGFGGQGGGGSLVYTDDEISSYSSIFDNAVFSGNSDKDKRRVITAIKNLNEGANLEEYFDVDAILRYFAAHNFVVNLDSYTSNMQQNYYIYERDGKLTILPWDYGLAFGGFQSGDASDVVNFPIDTPVSGVAMEDRPLLHQLLQVEEYSAKYHEYLAEIAEGYFVGGQFESTVDALDGKIGEYVRNDATAYFTYEEYEAALVELKELGALRAESVTGQLTGEIPSTTSGQSENPSVLIDASAVNLSSLGSMMGGGMRGGGSGGFGGRLGGQWSGGENPEGAEPTGESAGEEGVQTGRPGGGLGGGFGNASDMSVMEMPNMESMRQIMQILEESGWELTDDAKVELLKLGVTEEQIDRFINEGSGFMGRGGMGGFRGFGGENAVQTVNSLEAALILAALLAVLVAAIFFIAKPRRHTI